MAEAINGDLYSAVSFGQNTYFTVYWGTLYTEYIQSTSGHTGLIWAEIYGDFGLFNNEEPHEFVNFSASWCFTDGPIEGSVYACGTIIDGGGVPDYLTYEGYIVGEFPENTGEE